MAEETALLVFMPSGKRGRFPLGTPLLLAAQRLGVDLDSICGGRGLCGRCQVEPVEGSFAKHGIISSSAHVTDSTPAEDRYARRMLLKSGRRLGCQAMLQGDMLVHVPEDSQVHRQVVRKQAEMLAITIEPSITLHYVELEPEDGLAGGETASDLRRLEEAMAQQWQIAGLEPGLELLQKLQPAVSQGAGTVTLAVHQGRRMLAVWPGLHDRALGVAIDVGSTTLAGHLCDLGSGAVLASAGEMNPQIRFGEDLMSRVSYAMMNPGGATAMTSAVRLALCKLITQLAASAAVDQDDILELVLVGNPVMHHLLLGIDPTPLGSAPFRLAIDNAYSCSAHDLGMGACCAHARAYLPPCIAGHVGADTAAMLLAEAPHERDDTTLLVDIGTNAELVLGNRTRLLAASSPTGPAFEGAQISCGQRAAPGAIERVRIDRGSLEPRFRIIGSEAWSDEPGFAQAKAQFGITGICGSGIIDVLAELFLAGVIRQDGTIDGALAARSSRIRPDGRTFAYVLHDGEPAVVITQADVRAIQLAKAALYAGARLLMDHLGVDRVDRIRLAGAFGSHVDVVRAMVLGLIPDCDLDQVSSAGNAAGTGARIALLNRQAREEIEALVRRIDKIETATESRFQAHFVDAMALPHGRDQFPSLARTIVLPSPAPTAPTARQRRRQPPAQNS